MKNINICAYVLLSMLMVEINSWLQHSLLGNPTADIETGSSQGLGSH